MLNLLSGRIHQVVSGVVLCYKVNDIDSPGVLWGSHSMHSFSACTNVEFDHLSEDTIRGDYFLLLTPALPIVVGVIYSTIL